MPRPKYEPDKWNKNPLVKATHNCYSYFLNNIDDKIVDKCQNILDYQNELDKENYVENPTQSCKNLKPQPGYYSGSPKIVDKQKYNCENIHNRVLNDNPEIKVATQKNKCPSNYYKGALTMAPGLIYHFYRKDNNGKWSHKRGNKKVANLDADNELITDPKDANRDYGFDPRYNSELNLSELCSYYCIPNNDYKKKDMLDLVVPKHKTYDLVIVGAGISGLYLATRLQDTFKKIVIIEESNRYGGRIFSNKIKIDGNQYILEEGANRFSKFHTRLMKLIKKLDLSDDLIQDADESTKIYISTKLYNYHNAINIKDFFNIILEDAKQFTKKQLLAKKFTDLAKDVLSKSDYRLLKIIWDEFIALDRVSYNGGNNAKFRLHPTYNTSYCNLDLTDNKSDNRLTPYIHNYINLFKVDAFTGIRIIYTLLFNKTRNTYYRLFNGNISLCEKLLYQFKLNGGEVIYNTKFLDYNYQKNIFDLKFMGRLTKLNTKKIILAIPTPNILEIPKLNILNKYLSYSKGSHLAFIHAIYKKDKKTNKVWFHDIPWVTTDNVLRHIMPLDKKRGLIILAYLANSKDIDHFSNLYHTSTARFYQEVKKNLKILFPFLEIPKPAYLSFKEWDEGTYRWKRETDYCHIYKKIIFPFEKQKIPIYLSNESYSYRGGWIEGALEIADEIIDKIKTLK